MINMIHKKQRKRIIYIFLNVFFPLFIGFQFYIFFKPDTYVYDFVHKFLFLPTYDTLNFFVKCFYNWGCDFLWAYSFNSLLFLVLYQLKRNLLISILLTGTIGVALETFQFIGVLSGTFDFIDIISEVLAIIISGLIIKNLKVI